MKAILTSLLIVLLALPAVAQVPAPPVKVTGALGPGGVFPLFNNGTITMADADYNMTPNYDVTATVLRVISSVTLTGIHNVIVPSNTLGFQFTVENATTGGQSIIFKGTTGTGVTIPNGQTMLVISDGTNYVSPTGGGMVWPSGGAGIPNYAGGNAWGTTYVPSTNPIPFNLLSTSVPLAGSCTAGSYQTASSNTGPTCSQVQYSQLSGTVPTWNQSTTGNAATATNLSSNGTASQVWAMNSGGTAQGWQTPMTYPLTVAGTVNSGGIPYGSSTTQQSYSATLCATCITIGGGAGAAPYTGSDLTYSGGNLSIGPTGGGAGTLTLNGGTSGNVQLIPSATSNTLQLNGSAYTTLLVPPGSSSGVSIGSTVTTGMYFLGTSIAFANNGTAALQIGNNAIKCLTGSCTWSGTVLNSAGTFQSGVDGNASTLTAGAAIFKSASVTGGATSGGNTASATLQAGDNGATGGASQTIGSTIVSSGGFTGASGAATTWTPGNVIIQQKYWADATATTGTLACYTTPGASGQMPKVGTCAVTSNVAWIGIITGTQGQSVLVTKHGHVAAAVSNASATDTAGYFVCIDGTNAGKIIVQATSCTAGQGVGFIDITGSGTTSHSVDVERF